MKWYLGLPFSLILIVVAAVVSEIVGFNLVWITILGTALWAAIDSKKINLKKYKSGLSYSPVVLFIAVILLWIAGFPWYLHVRYKIIKGLAEPKESEGEPPSTLDSE